MASVIAKISTVLHKKFHRKVEVSKQLFSKEIHVERNGASQRSLGKVELCCYYGSFKDSMKFPIGYIWYDFLYLYVKISFRERVLKKEYPKLA